MFLLDTYLLCLPTSQCFPYRVSVEEYEHVLDKCQIPRDKFMTRAGKIATSKKKGNVQNAGTVILTSMGIAGRCGA